MNDTSSYVKNKAHVFDWDRVISKYEKLEDLPGDLPVSDSESERIVSVYNRAIDQIRTDNTDVAMIALEKVSVRWPLFIEASSLYGLLLAKMQRFAEAEKQFEKVLLASPDADIVPTINEWRKRAREEPSGRKRATARRGGERIGCYPSVRAWQKAGSCNELPMKTERVVSRWHRKESRMRCYARVAIMCGPSRHRVAERQRSSRG
jgi:tetratricopeptide (TPR) repeat protein